MTLCRTGLEGFHTADEARIHAQPGERVRHCPWCLMFHIHEASL